MWKPDFSGREIRNCILRSVCVSLFALFAFFMVHLMDNTVWITSIAASAFIAFAFPSAQSVRPRVLIGGYVCACVWGLIAYGVWHMFWGHYTALLWLCIAVIFFTTLSMTLFDFEHPPAAALSIGILLSVHPIYLASASLLFVVVLCIVKMPVIRLLALSPKKEPESTTESTTDTK